MHTYKRVSMRLMILLILTIGTIVLSRPQAASALTPCQMACEHADLLCQRACNTSPDPDCRINCSMDLSDCLAACG